MSLKRIVSYAGLVAALGCEAPASPSTKKISLQPTITEQAPAGAPEKDAKARLLTRIEVLIEVERLITPEQSCAYLYLKDALKKYPKDAETKKLQAAFLKALTKQVDERIGALEAATAEEMLAILEEIGADKAEVEKRRTQVNELLAKTGDKKADAEALVREGDLALQQAKLSEAEKLFQEALKLSPKLTPAQLGLAKVAFQQQNFAGAAKHATAILSHSPGEVEALVLLGDARYKSYDYQGALEAYQKALTISPSSKTAQRGAELCKKKLEK